jgi:hypothetical protein
MDNIGWVDDDDVWMEPYFVPDVQSYSYEMPHLQCSINTLSILIAI